MMYCYKISLSIRQGHTYSKRCVPKNDYRIFPIIISENYGWSYYGFWCCEEKLFLIPYFQLILIFLVVMVIIPVLNLKEKFWRNGFSNVFSILKIQWWFHVSKGILFIIIIYINNNKRFSSIYIQRIPTTHSNHL